ATKPAGGGRQTVYVFNVGSKDVTLIDPETRKVTGTRPLGAQVRWLSNEQTYWDGARVWTYDFPDNKLQAIAIDPKAVAVTKTVSFPKDSKPWMLRVSPDGKEVWVQTGGANTNVVLDADDLKTLATEPCGKGPVTNAWSPDRKYAIVTNSSDTFAQIFDARSY